MRAALVVLLLAGVAHADLARPPDRKCGPQEDKGLNGCMLKVEYFLKPAGSVMGVTPGKTRAGAALARFGKHCQRESATFINCLHDANGAPVTFVSDMPAGFQVVLGVVTAIEIRSMWFRTKEHVAVGANEKQVSGAMKGDPQVVDLEWRYREGMTIVFHPTRRVAKIVITAAR
jgi:hypothetical protein